MRIILFFIISLFSIVYGSGKPPACLLRPAASYKINSNADRNSRITGGEIANQGQFPWHVHMVLHDDLSLKICGGALINPKWVLTVSIFIKNLSKLGSLRI